jgi:hypothetical protein
MEPSMKSIKSGGGPLICVERVLAGSWLGTSGNSLALGLGTGDASDYERACAVQDYLGALKLKKGMALILGDMPLETMIWHSRGHSPPLIVRVFYMDPGVDVTSRLEVHGELDFSDPAESIDVDVKSEQMLVFDSAIAGAKYDDGFLQFDLPPGTYRVLTKQFEPDDRTSVLVHKFEPSKSAV